MLKFPFLQYAKGVKSIIQNIMANPKAYKVPYQLGYVEMWLFNMF